METRLIFPVTITVSVTKPKGSEGSWLPETLASSWERKANALCMKVARNFISFLGDLGVNRKNILYSHPNDPFWKGESGPSSWCPQMEIGEGPVRLPWSQRIANGQEARLVFCELESTDYMGAVFGLRLFFVCFRPTWVTPGFALGGHSQRCSGNHNVPGIEHRIWGLRYIPRILRGVWRYNQVFPPNFHYHSVKEKSR